MTPVLRVLLSLPALAALSACAEHDTVEDRFETSGELIALSGGDAGPAGACIGCHGLKGEGNGGDAPRLAGLSAGYIVRQMDYYATGLRRDSKMVWIADHIDRPQRIRLGEYYSALPVPDQVAGTPPKDDLACSAEIATLYHRGNAARGIPSCASCHGDAGEGNAGNPPLARQPAPYLHTQLQNWRDGTRYGDPQGKMRAISRLLTEGEAKALAGYSSALQGDGAYPAPLAACLPERRPGPRNDA